MNVSKTDTKFVRAERFPLQMRVRYRVTGSKHWFSGTTENISCSGVLFRARHRFEPHAPMDVLLRVPRQLTGDAPMNVLCCGYVSRIDPKHGSSPNVGLATAFVDCTVLNRTKPHSRKHKPRTTPELFHALNNELSVIIGSCDVALLRENIPDAARKIVTRVGKSGRRAAELIRQIRSAK